MKRKRTKTDKSIHDYAVRLRKSTDEQLTEKFYTAYITGTMTH